MPRVAVVSIGINYKGQSGELKGCINDSDNFVIFAKQSLNAKERVVFQLKDSFPKRSRWYPTKKNIKTILKQVVRDARRGRYTHVWLHYSGHGTQVRDKDGDEDDRRDEALVPVDFRKAKYIRDDFLRKKVVNKLPARVKLFALIDACHSGSMLDLRWYLEKTGRRSANKKASSKPNAMMISGCRDHRYSYDVYDAKYGASGAMTSAFLRAVNRNRYQPAIGVVAEMRKELSNKGYPQRPMLSVSRTAGPSARLFGVGELRRTGR
jgi:hypothetical protein